MDRKPAREKLNNGKDFVLAEMTLERQIRKYGQGTMLIPTPLEVDAIIREIPKGTTRTTVELGNELASRHGANVTCPMCFGMFWKLAALAAEEDAADGREDITPYWRVLKADGKPNDKLPGGAEGQAQRLVAEGCYDE